MRVVLTNKKLSGVRDVDGVRLSQRSQHNKDKTGYRKGKDPMPTPHYHGGKRKFATVLVTRPGFLPSPKGSFALGAQEVRIHTVWTPEMREDGRDPLEPAAPFL